MGNQLAPMVSRHPQAGRANGGDGVLPGDVLFEVLLRLPAKLLRAPRAVCRSWRSLLSDPLFAAAHAARHQGCRLLAVSARAVFDEVADVELLDTSSGSGGGRVVRRVARCAGPSYPRNPPMRAHGHLVLVVGDRKGRRLRVVDPFTGAVSVLPPAEPGHRGATATSVSVLGRATQYKVFNITVDADLTQSCKVLTFGGVAGNVGAWREAQKPPAIVRCDKPWVAAIAGGVVYILTFDRRDQTDWIATFDLDTEQWRPGLLQGPPSSEAVSGLDEMDGRLVAVSGSFFSGSGGISSSCVDLWLLTGCSDSDDDGEHEALWQEMCTVPLSRILLWSGEKVQEPVWVLNGGRVAFVVGSLVRGRLHGSVVAGDWVLRVYDPRGGFSEDVARLSNPTDVAIGVCTRSQLLACYVDQQRRDRSRSGVSHLVYKFVNGWLRIHHR